MSRIKHTAENDIYAIPFYDGRKLSGHGRMLAAVEEGVAIMERCRKSRNQEDRRDDGIWAPGGLSAAKIDRFA